MTLIVHAVLAVIVIGLIIWSNPAIFRRPATGPAVSALEVLYYLIGIASVVLGWYFNIKFVQQYADGTGNVFTGSGSWWQFITLGYDNPAAGSQRSGDWNATARSRPEPLRAAFAAPAGRILRRVPALCRSCY